MENARPTLRLKPKSDARPFKWGAPWVYADMVVTDRRTKAITPGTIGTLLDTAKAPVATVTINPRSKIIGRVLDTDPAAAIDKAWIRGRVGRAQALRDRIYPDPYYRLVHAEADGLPGLVIDRFGEALVVQPNAAWTEALLDDLVDVLREVTGAWVIVKNASGRARALEGLESGSEVLHGAIDAPLPVPMNGATYMADLIGGQKTGLYFDQRENHAFAARLAGGAQVLDVFSHVGGFGLAALAAGATTVLAVDGSRAALDLAEAGAAVSGLRDRFETMSGDAFDVMAALSDEDRTFDLVVADPPAFAPSKKALDAGLRAYERVARLTAKLVQPGGFLVLRSCSHAADLTKFRAASIRGIGRAGRRVQIIHTGAAGPDHPVHPFLSESGYLKALFFRVLA